MINENVLEEARQLMASFLKNRRVELKLSQQDVADKSGLARKTINAMEGGKFWLGMKQYLQICEALHLFPAIAEMEAADTIAEELRKIGLLNPKQCPINNKAPQCRCFVPQHKLHRRLIVV